MNLISILIALAIETFWRPVEELRRFDGFERFTDGFLARSDQQAWRDGPLGLLVVLGGAVFGVWLVDAMLHGVAAFFSFLFGIAVLVYCLGPKDLERELDAFLEALERGDEEAACLRATAMLGHDVGDNEQDMLEQVKAGLVIEANNRLFSVILWFMLLGPVGAALFRLTIVLRRHLRLIDSGFARSVEDLYRILIWLPARLLVLGFALAGSFVDTISRWRSFNDIWRADSEALLVESSLGAIAHEPHAEAGKPDLEGLVQLMALVKRTLMVWLAVLGLMTLTGWIL